MMTFVKVYINTIEDKRLSYSTHPRLGKKDEPPASFFYTKLKLKMYQIWDGFCAVAKLNGGRRSSATLTGMKQRHGVKDAQR